MARRHYLTRACLLNSIVVGVVGVGTPTPHAHHLEQVALFNHSTSSDIEHARRDLQLIENVDPEESSDEDGYKAPYKWFVVVLAAIELAWLFYSFQMGRTGWEPLWVIGVEGIAYCLTLLDANIGHFRLANGTAVSWTRYSGWLVTCPVLLLFLTAMTTFGGGQAPVRLVPLLIANQVMIISGISAHAYDGAAKWAMYIVSMGCGGIVLTFSIICLRSLYKLSRQDQSFHWGRLSDELDRFDASEDNSGDGALAVHNVTARHEAARKLISNHINVIRDITRADGPPTSQPRLVRLPGQENLVDSAIYEVARRLVGRMKLDAKKFRRPSSEDEAAVWAAAAKYLSARLQTTETEVSHVKGFENRPPDMSSAAGAALKAALHDVSKEEMVENSITNMLTWLPVSRERGWAKANTLFMSISFVIGWAMFPLGWTLGPPGTGVIDETWMAILFSIGDVLAKNIFAFLGVVIKFRYLKHLNRSFSHPRNDSPARGDGPAKSEVALVHRRDRRPSQIMMNETNETNSSFTRRLAAGPKPESFGPQAGEKQGSVSTEVLVMRAAQSLEMLCARLCATENFKNDSAMSQVLVMCDSILRLANMDDELANSEVPEEMKVFLHVEETKRTQDAMGEAPGQMTKSPTTSTPSSPVGNKRDSGDTYMLATTTQSALMRARQARRQIETSDHRKLGEDSRFSGAMDEQLRRSSSAGQIRRVAKQEGSIP